MDALPLFNYDSGLLPFDLAVATAGHDLRLSAGWVNGPVVRDCFAIQCCTAGRGVLVLSGKSFPIEKGQCFVSFPDVVLEERADEHDPWGILWVSLHGRKMRSYLDAVGINEQNPIFPWSYNQHIANCMQEILTLRLSSDISGLLSELQQTSCVCALLIEIFHLCKSDDALPSKGNSQESYVHAAISYIESHYSKNTKITEIADFVGLNRSYLYTIFKKHMGMSIQDYLISYRMKKACDFLALPQATIGNVAYSVGYDPLTFSKIFKRTIGVSPTDYRKQLGIIR